MQKEKKLRKKAQFIKKTWQINKNGVKYISITLKKEVVIMEKNVEISMLWQIYGKLLTEKQYKYIDYYYNTDLSLSEIAENENITRQAVRDIIKKGERKLFEYEEKLLFMRRTINQEKQIQNILLHLNKIQKNSSDKKVMSILDEIKKELNCLV